MEKQGREVSAPTVLLREIVELSADFERELGRDLGVNSTDLSAMEHLIQSGPLTPTEIARRLNLTTAAATTVIDRLSTMGHVTRAPHPTDRRGILVVPAEASVGKAMGSLMPMIMGIDAVGAALSESDRAVVSEYLGTVVERYRAHIESMASARDEATASTAPPG